VFDFKFMLTFVRSKFFVCQHNNKNPHNVDETRVNVNGTCLVDHDVAPVSFNHLVSNS